MGFSIITINIQSIVCFPKSWSDLVVDLRQQGNRKIRLLFTNTRELEAHQVATLAQGSMLC